MVDSDFVKLAISIGGSVLAGIISSKITASATLKAAERTENLQMVRNGETIKAIKTDTGTMLPVINNIDKRTDKQRDILDRILSDIDRRQGRDQANAESAANRDMITAGVQGLYNENYQLKQQIEDMRNENTKLIVKNELLQKENAQLKKKVAELTPQYHTRGEEERER